MLSSILQLNVNSSIPFRQLRFINQFGTEALCLTIFRKTLGPRTRPEGTYIKSDVSSEPPLCGQRCQTIKYLTTDNKELSINMCVLKVSDKLKQTRVGTLIAPLVFLPYPTDGKLCTIFTAYIIGP